jgi:phospholipase C
VYAVDPVQGLMGGPEASISRQAGSLPFPDKPVGTVNEEMPFDHVVVVMMENHSFDNLLGGLALTRLDVDGLTFVDGKATNSNPGAEGTPSVVTAFPLTTTAQGSDMSQSWKDTHQQINGGAMDGFVKTMCSTQPMAYYTPEVLPFAYSLAGTFTLANRWLLDARTDLPESAVSAGRHGIRRDSHE